MSEENTVKAQNTILKVNSEPAGDNISRSAYKMEKEGDLEGAAKLYWKIFSDSGRSDYESLERLACVLIDCGRKDTALKALEMLKGKIPDERRNKLCAETSLIGSNESVPEYNEEFIARYIELFRAREGVYAVQYIDASGRAAYRPVNEQFNADVLKAHLSGDITVGLYPIGRNNTVSWIAFDIDISRRFIENSNKAAVDEKMRLAAKTALRICDKLNKTGIETLVEFSGYKGYHVWCFFEKPIRSDAAKKLAERIQNAVGDTNDENISVEIFPKQTQVMEGGLGNLIKIPLGRHLKTGLKCRLLELPGLGPAEDEEKMIARVSKVPENVLRALEFEFECEAEKPLPSVSIKGIGKVFEKIAGTKCKTLNSENAGEINPAVQKALFNEQENSREVIEQKKTAGDKAVKEFGPADMVISGCAIISYLADKSKNTRYLTHDERVVLLYTLGLIENGGREAIHRIISNCSDYSVKVTDYYVNSLKTKARSCMGCYRIKQRLKQLPDNAKCSCSFEKCPPESYHNPLLHAGFLFARPSDRNSGYRPQEKNEQAAEKMLICPQAIRTSAEEYLKFKKEYNEIYEKLRLAKAKIMSDLRMSGIKRIDSLSGSVILLTENGEEKLATVYNGTEKPN